VVLVDSHSHFDQAEFDADRDAALARAHAAGVTRQVVPAVDAAGWPKLRSICASAPGLHPAYGLHPICLRNHRPPHLQQLRGWLDRGSAPRPVAVGECGLDYFIDGLDREQQQAYFDAQLRLAREFELPVIVHARRAVDAVIASVRRVGHLRGVVHSFSGSPEQARQLWDLGFLIGLGGPVTYERANRIRKVAATIPLEQLLLETDAPDQPNAGHQGERNEPSRLRQVLAVIAQLRGVDEEMVACETTANAERLFGI
jgi:TatD DNase family protein